VTGVELAMRGADAFLDLQDARLRFRDEGRGPAILFIHGWTLDLDIWDRQAEAFCGAYRVVRYDRRGFGGSTGSPSITGDVQDALCLLKHLRLAQVAAVGMSQGVRVALGLASAKPDLISCLVLDGAPPHSDIDGTLPQGDLPLDQFRVLAQQQGMPAFREAWAKHEFMRLQTPNPEAARLLDRVLSRYPGRDLLEPRRAETTRPIDIAAIRQRCLVLNGEFDTAQRQSLGRALAHELPAARYSLIPGAGHLANLDNPRAYNDLLREFFCAETRA
jgi:pimeloyl-ACP methyl ester carboxylesterase